MSEIVHTDALSLDSAVRKLLESWDLHGKDLVGLGTDGAANMVGEHHSLQTLIRRTWPHVFHIRCVCHGIDLAARDAVRKALPSNIEYMIRVSHNWFAHSFQRLSAYREVAQLIGFSNSFEPDRDDETGDLTDAARPLKLISPSETRWLVIADCLERILGQYDSLSAHFLIAYQKERCFEAKQLHSMFKDEQNRLFMLFVHPLLKDLRRINKIFQSNSGDNIKVYSELEAYFLALATRILKPAILRDKSAEDLCGLILETNFCLLPTEAIDLGDHFLQKLARSNLSAEVKNAVMVQAGNFLKELFIGLQRRLQGTKILIVYFKVFIYAVVTKHVKLHGMYPMVKSRPLQNSCSTCAHKQKPWTFAKVS